MNTFLWYLEAIWDYFAQMLPCALIAAAVFFCVRPARKRRLAAKGLHSGPWREGTLFLFVMFCAGLGALTLFQAGFWKYGHWYWVAQGSAPVFYPVDFDLQLKTIQWVPFVEIRGALHSPWRFLMLLGNTLLFAPLGFFPALLGRRPRWWKALLTGFCASFFIEFVQFFIGRSSDIDDVILNTLGALIGYWLFLLLRRLAPRFTRKFQCIPTEEVQHGRETGDPSPSA